ncbi:MAG: atpC [Clostridiaceae bacterium]|jgi:F-type H+-transporting ATPase subunit epsilon|nr:atpC [Clostridiaceae bacterium]
MEGTFKLTIKSPERELFSDIVIEVITEGEDGEVGILPNHIPMIKSLVPTITEFIDTKGKKYRAFTSSGVIKVLNNEAVILCEACEWPENIDLKRAEQSKARSEKRLQEKQNIDVKRAESSLLRALTRIKIKGI